MRRARRIDGEPLRLRGRANPPAGGCGRRHVVRAARAYTVSVSTSCVPKLWRGHAAARAHTREWRWGGPVLQARCKVARRCRGWCAQKLRRDASLSCPAWHLVTCCPRRAEILYRYPTSRGLPAPVPLSIARGIQVGEVKNPQVWDKWLEGVPEASRSIYVHAKKPNEVQVRRRACCPNRSSTRVSLLAYTRALRARARSCTHACGRAHARGCA